MCKIIIFYLVKIKNENNNKKINIYQADMETQKKKTTKRKESKTTPIFSKCLLSKNANLPVICWQKFEKDPRNQIEIGNRRKMYS